jgi:hypothetical protein
MAIEYKQQKLVLLLPSANGNSNSDTNDNDTTVRCTITTENLLTIMDPSRK